MNRRYVVQGSAMSLGEVLSVLQADGSALADGRVFVGRVRAVDPSQILAVGTEVSVSGVVAAGELAETAVLFEDDDFLSVSKPAGIPTVPSLQGARHSLSDQVARLRGSASYVVTSRLDREVSGVVTFAKTQAAAARIVQARAEGRLARRYVALSECPPEPVAGEWSVPIGRHKKSLLRAAFGPDAKAALSRYAVVESVRASLLALAPITGRTHQLRVHASYAKAPLLGDRDYGGAARIVLPTGKVLALTRIFLHCARVTLPLAGGREARVEAAVPPELTEIWAALGGGADAWNRAVSCEV